MSFILKLKHWQVFLILLMASITSNFTWENHELFNVSINSAGTTIYFFWYFAVGMELTEYLPRRLEFSKTLFILNSFIILISMLMLIAVFDGHFTAVGFFEFLWIGYLIFAIIQFLLYPSKALRTVEQNNDANFAQYVGYFLLIIFWPVGIWWIQPKLNKIAGKLESQQRMA